MKSTITMFTPWIVFFHARACLCMHTVQYSRRKYAQSWLANCTRKEKTLASSAGRCSFTFTAGQPVSAPVWKMDSQWSPLTFHIVFSFGGANNNHLAGFPTSASIVYSHVWIGPYGSMKYLNSSQLLVWQQSLSPPAHMNCARDHLF